MSSVSMFSLFLLQKMPLHSLDSITKVRRINNEPWTNNQKMYLPKKSHSIRSLTDSNPGNGKIVNLHKYYSVEWILWLDFVSTSFYRSFNRKVKIRVWTITSEAIKLMKSIMKPPLYKPLMKYFDVSERPNHCFWIQGNTFPNGQYALLMPRNIRYFRPVIIKRFLLQLNTTFCPKIQTTWIIFQHLLTKLSDDSIQTRFRGQLYQTPPKTIVGKH